MLLRPLVFLFGDEKDVGAAGQGAWLAVHSAVGPKPIEVFMPSHASHSELSCLLKSRTCEVSRAQGYPNSTETFIPKHQT